MEETRERVVLADKGPWCPVSRKHHITVFSEGVRHIWCHICQESMTGIWKGEVGDV